MGSEPLRVDELIEELRERASRDIWAPAAPTPLHREEFGDPLDGHPAIEYLHRNWTRTASENGGTGANRGVRASISKALYALPRRALRRERELLTQLASLSDALVTRCRQLEAQIDDLHAQLDERALEAGAREARLAAELDSIRRKSAR